MCRRRSARGGSSSSAESSHSRRTSYYLYASSRTAPHSTAAPDPRTQLRRIASRRVASRYYHTHTHIKHRTAQHNTHIDIRQSMSVSTRLDSTRSQSQSQSQKWHLCSLRSLCIRRLLLTSRASLCLFFVALSVVRAA